MSKIDEISESIHTLANDLMIIHMQAEIISGKYNDEYLQKMKKRVSLAVENIVIIQAAWREHKEAIKTILIP
jgi:hypothetical protein